MLQFGLVWFGLVWFGLVAVEMGLMVEFWGDAAAADDPD